MFVSIFSIRLLLLPWIFLPLSSWRFGTGGWVTRRESGLTRSDLLKNRPIRQKPSGYCIRKKHAFLPSAVLRSASHAVSCRWALTPQTLISIAQNLERLIASVGWYRDFSLPGIFAKIPGSEKSLNPEKSVSRVSPNSTLISIRVSPILVPYFHIFCHIFAIRWSDEILSHS